MLSVQEINLLRAQNEGLIKQNKELQAQNRELQERLEKLLKEGVKNVSNQS